MKTLKLLPLVFIGCSSPSKNNDVITPRPKNESASLKNFATFSDKSINSGLVLGSGANHLYPFDEQPGSFAACLIVDDIPIEPTSKTKANIYLKIENSFDERYEKESKRIYESIAIKAKEAFMTMDANSIAKSFNEIAKKNIADNNSIEVVFSAKRLFKRVALEKLAIRGDVMNGVDMNPFVFYHRCGTSGVVSVIKEVNFIAKAVCKRNNNHSSTDILKEIENKVDVSMVANNIFEIGGTYGVATNLNTVLNALSKNGVHTCEWEFESQGIPTQTGSVGLIDMENLINTAQKGLDLVFQSTFEQANYVQMELKPYYLFAAPEGHEEFFRRFNNELKENENKLKKLEEMGKNQLEYLTLVAKATGINPEDKHTFATIESLKVLYKTLNFLKESPLSNRKYSSTYFD